MNFTLIEWRPLKRGLQRPPTTTCLFTDGVSYWAGWWSNTNQIIVINNMLKQGDILTEKEVSHWAQLYNVVEQLGIRPKEPQS